MSFMRTMIIILFFIISLQPVFAETYDPSEEPSSDMIVSKDAVPEQIKDMVTAPRLADERYALPERRSVGEAGWKAAFFPGWGHWYLEHYNKAGLIWGAEAVVLVGIMNSDTEKYVNAKTEVRDAVYQQRETLGLIGGLIWLWNIYDAVGLALENNRVIDEEEKKLSLIVGEDMRLAWRGSW